MLEHIPKQEHEEYRGELAYAIPEFGSLDSREKRRVVARWIREVKAPQAEKLKRIIPTFNQKIDLTQLLVCLDDMNKCKESDKTMTAEAEGFLDWHKSQ